MGPLGFPQMLERSVVEHPLVHGYVRADDRFTDRLQCLAPDPAFDHAHGHVAATGEVLTRELDGPLACVTMT